jgi:hypothetical protein
VSPAERRAQLAAYAAHYARREAEPYLVTGDKSRENPWTGFRRACERALARIPTTPEEAPCERSSETAGRSPQTSLDLG